MATKITATKAIKLFCLECVCNEKDEIRNCTAKKCPLYDFRPYKPVAEKSAVKNEVKAARGAKIMTEAHKLKMAEGRKKKKADKEAAGVVSKKATKPVLNTEKAKAARARMTPAHKAKMAAGRAAKKAKTTSTPVVGYVEVSAKEAINYSKELLALGKRTSRGH